MKFEATLAFYPNQKNPARDSGMGVYRVISCAKTTPSLTQYPYVRRGLPGRKLLVLLVDRLLKPKSRVDPVRLTLARLQAAA